MDVEREEYREKHHTNRHHQERVTGAELMTTLIVDTTLS
jgi:hypothetical protein